MYAPPLQDVEVTAQDFIRAFEREADPKASSGGYPFYYSAIEGFDDFGSGEADSISGLSRSGRPDVRGEDHANRPATCRGAWRCRRPRRSRRTRPTRGSPRCRRGTHDQLRTVPRRHGSVHVRGKREPGLLGACEGPGDRSPATCPVARSSWFAIHPTTPATDDLASGVPGPDRGHDRWRRCRPLQQGRYRRDRLRRRRRDPARERPAGVLHQPRQAAVPATSISRTWCRTSR